MVLYFILLGISILLSFLEFTNIKKKYKYIALYAFFCFCIILSGIRWEMGTDWSLYYPFYRDNLTLDQFLGESDDPSRLEAGYALLNFLHMKAFDDYSLFMLMMAALTISIKLRWMIRYTRYPLIAGMVYFTTYLGDIFYIRQYIAIAITMLSFDYIVERKPIKFIAVVFLATSIHTSAIIFLLAYLIYNNDKIFSIKKLLIALFLFIGMDVTSLNKAFLEEFLSSFSSDLGKAVQKVHAYTLLQEQGSNFGASIDNTVRMGTAYVRRFLFLPIYLWMSRYMNEVDPSFERMLKLVLFGYIIFFLGAAVSYDFAGRLNVYYTFFEILLISMFFEAKLQTWGKILLLLFVISYCIVKYVFLIQTFPDAYIPFHSVF